MNTHHDSESPAHLSTCTKGTKIEGHPGLMEYEFDPPLSLDAVQAIVAKVPMFNSKDFPYSLGTGFTQDGKLHVSLGLNTKWVDNFFSTLNATGLIEINMSLSSFQKAPQPIVDMRLPMLVPMEAGDQITYGFTIEHARGDVRAKTHMTITAADRSSHRKVDFPEGKTAEDIRIVPSNEDPNQMVMWPHDDGKEYPFRKIDIPKAH